MEAGSIGIFRKTNLNRKKVFCWIELLWIRHRVCVLSCSVVSSSLQLLWTFGLQPTGFLCPWDFCRQDYWSGLPFPSSGDLPDLGGSSWPTLSSALKVDCLPAEPSRKPESDDVEDNISELEIETMPETTQNEKRKKKSKNDEEDISEVWDNPWEG